MSAILNRRPARIDRSRSSYSPYSAAGWVAQSFRPRHWYKNLRGNNVPSTNVYYCSSNKCILYLNLEEEIELTRSEFKGRIKMLFPQA
jgi:hypothetical protein